MFSILYLYVCQCARVFYFFCFIFCVYYFVCQCARVFYFFCFIFCVYYFVCQCARVFYFFCFIFYVCILFCVPVCHGFLPFLFYIYTTYTYICTYMLISLILETSRVSCLTIFVGKKNFFITFLKNFTSKK
jgi:hypothetical protein